MASSLSGYLDRCLPDTWAFKLPGRCDASSTIAVDVNQPSELSKTPSESFSYGAQVFPSHPMLLTHKAMESRVNGDIHDKVIPDLRRVKHEILIIIPA
mmetsp:Transcript_40727/g.128376  ORF Transcript_40727/g.128376 Transcript_40727/m.128376 type:complete len:98 (-) Transcript_40727:107-400(-)